MSRPYIYIQAEKKEPTKQKEIGDVENKIVRDLYEYLDDYQPDRFGKSKSNLMGPVGKLVSAVSSDRFENKSAIVGYIANIHNNVSSRPISQNAYAKLQAAVDGLEQLRKMVPSRMWLRVLREIDYAVFARQYERISLAKKQ